MKKASRLFVIAVLLAAFAVFSAPHMLANSCSATPASANAASDLESTPPSIDGIRMLSVKQEAIVGGYTRSWLPFSGERWEGLRGAPVVENRTYVRDDRLILVQKPLTHGLDYVYMTWQVEGKEPGDTTPSLFIQRSSSGKIAKPTHYHVAITNPDGSFQIMEGSRLSSQTTVLDNGTVSAFNLYQCVNGEKQVVRSVSFPKPVAVRQKLYSYGSYCEIQSNK